MNDAPSKGRLVEAVEPPAVGAHVLEHRCVDHVRVGLPSGQDVAATMRLAALTPDEVASGDDAAVLRERGLHKRTPLWYYVLKEAEVQANASASARSAAGSWPRCS